MRRVECESCEAIQPADWSVGDACYDCGAQARVDVACAWCCHYVPDAKFCRDCGFEMVEPELFAVARMLKSSNIDKLSLPAKTQELPSDHADHYRSMYNRDYAILMTRVEELRLAEQYLLHKGYSFDLELEYLDQLPLDDDTKARLSVGPKGPFQDRPARLAEIIETSPVSQTRWLAKLALLHQTDIPLSDEALKAHFKMLVGEVSAEHPPLIQSEILAGLTHWTILPLVVSGRHSFFKTEINQGLNKVLVEKVPTLWPQMTDRAQKATAPLLCLATGLPEVLTEQVGRALDAAQTAENEDLVFAAQLTGKAGAPLLARVNAADARTPDAKAEMAASFLAFYQMPQLHDLLTGEDNGLKDIALKTLLGTADGKYEDHSLRALLQILRSDINYPLKDKILKALEGSAYHDDANQLLLSASKDDPSALIDAIKRGGNLAPVLDGLMAHDVSPEILDALTRKISEISFGPAWMDRIWNCASEAETRSPMQRSLTQFFRKLFIEKSEDAYFALKAALPDMLAAKGHSLEVMKSAVISNFDPSFVPPQQGEAVAFNPGPEQLSLVLDDVGSHLTAYGESLRTADKEAAEYLIRYLWDPHADAWISSVLAHPLSLPNMVAGHQAIASNTNLWENNRNTGMKALLALAPHMEPEPREAMMAYMEGLEKITPLMHSFIPRLREQNP